MKSVALSNKLAKQFIPVSVFVFATGLVFANEIYKKNLETRMHIGVRQIANTAGATIHYRYDHGAVFHDSEFLHAKTAPFNISLTTTVLPVIESFLAKYPTEIIRKNLTDIYLTSGLEFNGKRYGGTYKESKIYVVVKDRYSGTAVLSILHAEFSSILMQNYVFPRKAWESINGLGWKYSGNGFGMLEDSGLFEQSDDLLRNGFLTRYSQSNLENDFNEIIDWTFTKPDRLREIAVKYEKIRAKYDLALAFYDSIDRRINIPRF